MSNRIREIRIKRGMKLVELARLSNLSNGYISHLENGTRDNPSYHTMQKIAKALGKNLTDVFDLERGENESWIWNRKET